MIAAIEGIVEAASLADVEGLTRGMAAGIPVDVRDDKGNPLLVLVCKSRNRRRNASRPRRC